MEENDVNPEEVFSWCEKVTAAVLRSVNTVEAGYQLEERLVVLFREGLGMVHEIYSDET
jgi:hypothetical protein